MPENGVFAQRGDILGRVYTAPVMITETAISEKFVAYSTGEPLEGECLEFRLLYYGRVLSGNKSHVENKHQIRLELAPQIKRLIECKPVLYRACYREGFNWFKNHPDDRAMIDVPGIEDEKARKILFKFWERHMAERWTGEGAGLFPLSLKKWIFVAV